MPNGTGIKKRVDYINRLLKEDEKTAGKDKVYGAYLQALTKLVQKTNEIYEEQGKLTKKSYEELLNAYYDVTEKASNFKENGKSDTRMNVVNHIQKIISRDVKALNDMDKEKLGNIDDAFENSRVVKVSVPEGLSDRVGGQMSDRFPMVSSDGKKGFFTARTVAAQDKKWDAMLDRISKIELEKDVMEKINQLKTNHTMRNNLLGDITMPDTMKGVYSAIAVELEIFEDTAQADEAWEKKEYKPLIKALDIIAKEGIKLTSPYNMVSRLGYDPYTRNDNKNAAMYEVAKLLGCEKLVAKAVPMVVVNGDQVIKGTFMEHAEGSDLSNLKANDPLWNYDRNTSAFNKSLYRDLADLQIIDYICGNIDRHKGNMCYKTAVDKEGNVTITGIVAIDNDASFPEKDISEREYKRKQVGGNFEHPRIFKPENFRFVNKETAEIIKNMTRGQLETILRGHNISPEAIDRAWARANHVKEVFAEMYKHKINYTENIKEGVLSDMKNWEDSPFYPFGDFADKRSIFTDFDREIRDHVTGEKLDAIKAQQKRNPQARKAVNNNPVVLNMEEYAEYKNKKDSKVKVAQAQVITHEEAILANSNKIASMNAVMERINRLKTASKEFATMREAMFKLAEEHKKLIDVIKDSDKLSEDQFQNYGKCLDALNDATKDYVMAKGLTPITGKGRERLEGALKIDHGIEDLIKGFKEFDKTYEAQTDDYDIEQDNVL